MAFYEIKSTDLIDKGNIGKPNPLGVSVSEAQRILDEIPREVIVPKFNLLVQSLNSNAAASQLKTTDGTTLQNHVDNGSAHTSSQEKDSWNAGASLAAAALPRSGGTLTGMVKAGGALEPGTAQLRNISAGTQDLQAGVSALATGEIYLVYE